MDLKRVAAAAVEAAFNPDGAAQQEHEPERKHGGMSSVRTVAAGAALALAARVAVKKGPSLLPKTLMPNVMPSFSDVTDRVRDVLADQGWFDDEEDEDDADYEDEAELEEGEDEEDDDEPEDFVDDEEEPEDAEDEEEDGEPEDFVDDEEEPEDAEDEEEDDEPEDYYEPEDDEEHDVDPVARPPRPPRSSANSSAR
jgi:hypothetical protein